MSQSHRDARLELLNTMPSNKQNSAENGTERAALERAAGFSLLDGAGPGTMDLGPHGEEGRRIAADAARPLQERLEAYEDLLESQVGDTLLYRARNIEREVGLRQIYVKFEGDNPSGTQKDRIAFAQVLDALRRGFDCVSVATCGNYGAAMAIAAALAGLRTVVFIPESYHTRRIQELASQGVEIRRTHGDYEAAVAASRAAAHREEWYDANPGGDNTTLQLRGYGEIGYEIYDELRDAPTAVAVPVSNGTTLAGVWRGFVSLHRRGKTSHLPQLVAGSSFGKNPIVRSFLKGLERCEDLPPESIRETEVNEPLVNWSSIDGGLALEAVRRSGGWAAFASDRAMQQYARMIRDQQGLSVLPAATAGLIALLERHRKTPLPPGRYVVLLTGRKS